MFIDESDSLKDNITVSDQIDKTASNRLMAEVEALGRAAQPQFATDFSDPISTVLSCAFNKELISDQIPVSQERNLQTFPDQQLGLARQENDRNSRVAIEKISQVERDDSPAISRGLATPCYKWQDRSVEARGAVLLIHAFPAHGKLYDNLARKLAAEGMVVYAPDLRGLGRAYSSGLAPRLDYECSTDSDMAVLAERIRKENPGMPLIVGGESMGGAFSIRLAALHPELVDGLILSGAAIINVPHYAGLIPQGIRNVLGPRHPQVDFSNQIRRFFSDDPRITCDLLNDPLVRKRFDVNELTQCQRVSRDTVGMVGAIRPEVPVLVLQSVDDMQTAAQPAMRVYDRSLHSRDYTPALFSPRGHVLIESPYMQKDVEDTVLNWVRTRVPQKKK